MCHHNKHLMGYFEFLPGSRIIFLPLNISEKLHWQHLFEKLEEVRYSSPSSLLIRCNTYIHPEKQHLYSNKRLSFFHSDTNPVLGHVMVHSVDKTHVLVVTVKLIWLFFLNILSFNFVLRLPAVVLTNHCQSYTTFLLNVCCSKWPHSFFCSCFSQW